MTDLYDQHIDAMKARERAAEWWDEYVLPWDQYVEERANNMLRDVAYRRKRAIHLCKERHRDPYRDMTGPDGPLKAWELYK
jgi:hypothetical protein